MNWRAAKGFCNSRFANLVSFHSRNETNFVKADVIEGTESDLWTGGYQASSLSINAWRWEDGTIYDFGEWYDTEPNEFNESKLPSCVSLSERFDYKWFDANCNDTLPFICKK